MGSCPSTFRVITLKEMAPRTKLVAIHPIHGYAIKPQQDLKTIKRNERERNRVETVNKGFETLRLHVPTAAMVKKMSKVNIINHAMDYIQNLTQLLRESASENTAWTYNCSQPQTSPLYHPSRLSHSQTYSPPQYQHRFNIPSYPPPLTPISPPTSQYHSESGYETTGYYSDSGMGSPAVQRSNSWDSSSPSPSPYVIQTSSYPCHTSFPIKQENIVPDSTVHDSESSGEEDDVLDAIAEWQQV